MDQTPDKKTIFGERIRVSKERLDVCGSCEEFEPENKMCKVCGCFMAYKTLFPWATCPQGKWSSNNNGNQ